MSACLPPPRSLEEHRKLLEESSRWRPNGRSFPTQHVTVPLFATQARHAAICPPERAAGAWRPAACWAECGSQAEKWG